LFTVALDETTVKKFVKASLTQTQKGSQIFC